ncbi:MAG: hydantoinase/oxoprolinase family protein [Chloroflexi bacterium]|nr:hydantoinase/oxoprolinase family protein [Chloroflexota bacterium]MCY3581857.1 hydantoinase/oxoprolinase family protein [Chloroflexota bacterium]MXV92876.1 hydantoinase/oxoprolinase family protein [Chloroflexota bacterium]MXX51716.1 hydantoinase/oxoprolinase family protein [Chloroflexota bacterium]MXX83746.1 hydantoinase/oxoprolinase family protein [Chloroflexota bacterium]
MRIGIDVGGTNTDAVLMDGARVVSSTKTPTTANVSEGIATAMRRVIADSGIDTAAIDGVMIGTTHFTNAVVERKRLTPTACIRLGLPATVCLPPMVDWPQDLRELVGGESHLAHGGHEFDGREISAYQPDEVRAIVAKIRDAGLDAIAISSVFSPVNATFEEQTADIVREAIPDANITLSSEIGRIGLLERENAAIMNSCLRGLAARTVDGFKAALDELQIRAPFYISQNDGTLMNADFAKEYPVLTFASGPTNSMRGAAFLSGLRDAIVVDVGGTTTDIGVLQHGFPRPAALAVDIGGVRTNFRMPDTYSIGLGGGSLVTPLSLPIAMGGSEAGGIKVGPQSVGYELTSKALVFGGDTLTATDVIVAGGSESIGDAGAVSGLDVDLVAAVKARIMEMIAIAVDRMKTSATPVPVIVVGGGSILVTGDIEGASEIIKPEHFPVANAIGAAIAQVGGECDRIFSLAEMSREDALDQAKAEASERAVNAGASASSIEIVDVEEVPLAYLPGNATRIMVKAIGDLVEA